MSYNRLFKATVLVWVIFFSMGWAYILLGYLFFYDSLFKTKDLSCSGVYLLPISVLPRGASLHGDPSEQQLISRLHQSDPLGKWMLGGEGWTLWHCSPIRFLFSPNLQEFPILKLATLPCPTNGQEGPSNPSSSLLLSWSLVLDILEFVNCTTVGACLTRQKINTGLT